MKKTLTTIVAVLGVLYGFYEFYDDFFGGEDYGTKIEIGLFEIYYTDNVNESKTNELGHYMDSIDLSNGQKMFIQFDKQNSVYQVNMAFGEGVANNVEYTDVFRNIVNEMKDSVFPNDSLALNLTDDSFITQESILYDVMLHKPYGDMMLFNGTEVYYRNVNVALANSLGNYLVESGFADGTGKSFQLIKIEEKLIVKMTMSQDYISNPELETAFQEFRSEIIAGAFENQNIELHLSLDSFETKQIFK